MKDQMIPLTRRMARRIQLKITPRIVNEQFRAALDRYNNPSNCQSDHKEPAPLTREMLYKAVRRLK